MTAIPSLASPSADVALRVLHVIPGIWPGSGGPSRAVIEMCRAVRYASPDIQVDIATTDHGLTDTDRAAVEAALPAGTRLVVMPESKGLDAGWSWSLARWLDANIRAYGVLHIHALFGTTSAVAAFIARRHGVPYVIRPLGTLSPYTFANRRTLLKRAWFRLIDKATVEGSAAVHFTAPQESAKAARLDLRCRAVVLPLPYGSAATAARHPDDHVVLFLSRLHPVKGLDLLLPAFTRVRAAVSTARLIIGGAGEPAYERGLRNRVRELGLDDAVEFRGFVQGAEKAELLARASLFVLPSYQENFGMAVVEAMAASLPVVITRQVDLWPDVERDGAGIVTQSTPECVAAAIVCLLRDSALRDTMGAAAGRHVTARYSSHVIGGQLAALYRSVRGSFAAPRASRIHSEPTRA